MRKINKFSGLYQYLLQQGVLEKGTEEEIKLAKRHYWRAKDKEYKKEKRTRQKREIVLVFPADEINHIRFSAKAKSLTIHEYVRACVKADMSQLTVIPHKAQVAEIMQVMRQCNNQLEAIKNKEVKGWLVISRTYENVETVLTQTESRIITLLKQPQNLKDTIMETINRNPNTLDLLKSILTNYGYQISDQKNGIV
jgi:hypothetical protein